MKKEYFWADEQLQTHLRGIRKGEKSCIIRIALRDYFKLTDSKNGQIGYKEDKHEQSKANE